MMRYNLRLVYSIAKQHQNRGLDMDDMLPEGVIGLERAIDKFEPEKGFRFSTYSHWWIRQHIHRYGLPPQGSRQRLRNICAVSLSGVPILTWQLLAKIAPT